MLLLILNPNNYEIVLCECYGSQDKDDPEFVLNVQIITRLTNMVIIGDINTTIVSFNTCLEQYTLGRDYLNFCLQTFPAFILS